MTDLLFKVYKVKSPIGYWLAAFEQDELIFLGSYEEGKAKVETEFAKIVKSYYGFDIGKFTPANWTGRNFWKAKHKIKLMGTELQMKVWLELLKIPRGTTLTYSDLAKKVKKPKAVRAVASAVARNPIAYYIPCHRVVGKNSNTLKYAYGPAIKRSLLISEGALSA